MGENVSSKPVRLLVVDDSTPFTHILVTCLSAYSDVDVVGVARNGREALAMIDELSPDVVTLDLEMPVMDGMETLEVLHERADAPRVIVLSGRETVEASVMALRRGAFDFLMKPETDHREFSAGLVDRLRVARRADARASSPAPLPVRPAPWLSPAAARGDFEVVVIGISTGGPVALERLLCELPSDFAVPVVIVQHMPREFTRQLADALDKVSNLEVVEASEGVAVKPGRVVLARGGCHLLLERTGDGVVGRLGDDARVNGCVPAVDVTLSSAAEVFGKAVLGVVMTGMGSDGVDGARAVKNVGGSVVVQDEASSVVFGMPAAVIEAGLHDEIVPLTSMAQALTNLVGVTEEGPVAAPPANEMSANTLLNHSALPPGGRKKPE